MFESPKKTKKFLKIAIFGKGGSGKTRFALGFPAPVLVDTEKGSDPYTDKYDFKVKRVNQWKDLEPIMKYCQKGVDGRHTLIIDSATIFYQSLINDLAEYAKAKRGNEIMTQSEWGVEKRRWSGFLNMLVFMPMHVILTFREKDEYTETVDREGKEIRKKTGDTYAEADKQTEYIFDLAFRCYTEENRKAKTSKFFVQCVKSRYDWMPKYSTHDVTKVNVYEELFQQHVKAMMDAPAAEEQPVSEQLTVETVLPPASEPMKEVSGEKKEEKTEPEKAPEAGETPEMKAGNKGVEGIRRFFGGNDPEAPAATAEDIKVLMTRCGQLAWPDGRDFSSEDGKKMIRNLYDLESTKDMKKYQADFLYREFGEVLSGRAHLALDEVGVPYVARNK